MLTAKEWSVQFSSLKERIQAKRKHGEIFTYQEAKVLINTLNTLDEQLKQMVNSPLQYEISHSELARRQILVENIRKQCVSSTNTNQGISAPTSYNPVSTSDQGLLQRQKDMIKVQDDMLLDIGAGVNRLHGQAIAIGDEVKMSTRLLDDLEDNVDLATSSLNAEAKHAAAIKEKAKVCYMYICIAIEVIIIFLLIILLFTH